MVKVSIITIGDELLIGQVIDTNSAWIAQQLNKIGIPVKRRVAVGDIATDIETALNEESKHADVILITGGLGPTADDITKPLLCKYFNGKMIVNEEALANVRYLFEDVFKRPLTERNIKQAEVPDTCTVIQNKRGTAPGMLFEKNGKFYISMPGVPHEMKGMIENDVIPFLVKEFNVAHIAHRTLTTFGIGESMIADKIIEFESALPAAVRLAYLPNYGMVRLRLTATGLHKEETENEIDHYFLLLQQQVKDHIITNKDEPMEKIIAGLLLERKKTMCTAESCSGGYIAHLVTSIPGSSAFYDGSVVSYSYKAKEDLLGVDEKLLLDNGAVSEEVVIEMANGALRKIGSDYAIAVSGIMGPDGGTPDKPVGTVWIAVGSRKKVRAKKLHFRFERKLNIELTAVNALNLLRQFIIEEG
ncbi:MAG: competence/damage-inducible protein A [Bacteroidetes bacterium]|nr:competence/damage-inducible protein A [Bacteroidota bacterium]